MPRSHRRLARQIIPSDAGGTSTLTVGPWILPTKASDGSAIGTISDQRVYFDNSSRMGTGVNYSYAQNVGNGTSLSKVVTGLKSGLTYYFAVVTIVGGIESDYSAETSAVAP